MQLTDHTTIPQLIRNVVKYIHPVEHTFLIHKVNDNYENISYKTALTKIDAISAYLISIGVQKADRLALMMDNCPDYIFFDQASRCHECVDLSYCFGARCCLYYQRF
jgi:long-chain acyl-CoA synthetase